MNRNDETMNPTGPESQVDRLVDGELNDSDRRELLLQFEREPEGWRRAPWRFWKPSAGSRNWVRWRDQPKV